MAKANLIIDLGTDFSKELTVTDDEGDVVNLTGYTAAGQIRKHYSSNTATNFTCTFASDRTTGKITISLGRTLSQALAYGRYVYDVVIADSASERTKVLEGTVLVNVGVTKIPRDTVYPPT